MINQTPLFRTFYISFGEKTGTAFTLECGDKQYLITANHLVEGIQDNDSIEIHLNGKPKNISVKVVGLGNSNELGNDIAVLATTEPLYVSKVFKNSEPGSYQNFYPTHLGIYVGIQTYFLGFPFGDYTKMSFSEGHTVPFVKGAILSCSVQSESGDFGYFVLDGFNNEGFSGGPAIFEKPTRETNVFGVVSSYQFVSKEIEFEGVVVEGLTNKENTGLIFCSPISKALEKILVNQIGCEFNPELL